MLAKRWLIALFGALILVAIPVLARTAYAHAVLVRSEPAANATLSESPHEVRLWFTEPLEPTYSTIELRDSMGQVVDTPPSYVEPTDDHQLVLMTGELPAGLYTVVWRNVSSADGHGVSGGFPFIVGEGNATEAVATLEGFGLDTVDILARWVNFWGVALAIGSIAFIVLVWLPSMRAESPTIPSALWIVIWVGWLAAGIGGVLLLLNQTAVLLNEPVRDVIDWGKLWGVLNETRFGALWLQRMGLWLVMGGLLLAARRSLLMAWLATGCGLLMLLPISMHSHSAAGNDVALSVFSDWVHLAMMSLWLGGLVIFLVAIPILLRVVQPVAPKAGEMVANFSNVARIAVVGLIVTGIYATWYQVSSLEALTTTLYGQLLLVKLALAVVLLLVAAVNLIWTQRRLLAGQAVWVGRLRGLISVEVILLFAILLVVGVMTGISPARNVIAQREAAAAIPPAPEAQPIHMTAEEDDLQIHFSASPGWVGNSTFTIQMADEEGEPVTDASLIRMRFENETQDMGESELQIHSHSEAADGIYTVEGANLSAAGDWRIRMTIQRPDEFDIVTDLEFNVASPPPPPATPVIDLNAIPPYRTPVLLLAGLLAALAGIYLLVEQRSHLLQGTSLLASLLVVLGVAFLWTGFFR